MRQLLKTTFLLPIVIFSCSAIATAGGLSSRFVEVKLKGLEPGATYSVKEEAGKPLTIENTTEDITVDIAIEPEAPVDYNLVTGYEPIPDLSWITIEEDYFEEVGPGTTIETDIKITIPEDEGAHKGRKYQVYIYSHTAGQSTFRMGLMGRLLVEVAE